jgi:hypothetical protein
VAASYRMILDESTKAEAFPSEPASQAAYAARDRIPSAEPECLELAAKVARWTINSMQPQDGHSYYRDLGWGKVKTPMFHLGLGIMFKALAHLLSKVNGRASTSEQRHANVARESHDPYTARA